MRKKTGSFYSPSRLAYYVASKIGEFIPSNKSTLQVLDPAVGDGALLLAMSQVIKPEYNAHYYGVDIDSAALQETSMLLSKKKLLCHLYKADFIKWIDKANKTRGISKESLQDHDQMSIIISNPPWGADYDDTFPLSKKLNTAIGQYDIYDLFLEKSLDLLQRGDAFGFIIPDSIFRKEHLPIRKKLLSETCLKYIIRIGEFIFNEVNTSVSIIVGIKGYRKGNTVCCANLPNSYTKQIAAGIENFGIKDSEFFHECNQDSFVEDNYTFSIDIEDSDSSIFAKLNTGFTLKDFLSNARGVELSKKGYVIQCPHCRKWMPKPKNESFNCPHCGQDLISKDVVNYQIIRENSDKSLNGSKCNLFVAGEDMQRYSFATTKRIMLGFNGINYKSENLYSEPKILVRKTGVGITAVLDYKGCYVNQVVYVLKNKVTSEKEQIPLEFFIALLNSRVITYWILKKYGASKWVTHPYLSQQMVGDIPVPDKKSFTNNDWNGLAHICNIIKETYRNCNGMVSNSNDMVIESIILRLFRLDRTEFEKIFDAIDKAEKLIPFKRLLTIPKEQWVIDI